MDEHFRVRDLLTGVTESLSSGQVDIERAAKTVEGRFGQAGDIMGSLSEMAAAVGKRAEQLAEFAARKEALVAAYQLFKKSTDLMEANLERTHAIDQRLSTIQDLLDECRRDEEAFAEGITTFWSLSTSVRIQAAHLDAKDSGEISQLADTMSSMQLTLKGAVRAQSDRIDETRSRLLCIRHDLSEVRQGSKACTESSRTSVHGMLDALEGALGMVTSHLIDARAQKEQFERAFAGILVDLQFQDILRQELERVGLALGFVATWQVGQSPSDVLALAHQVATIQEQQLAVAKAGLDKASRSVLHTLQSSMSAADGVLDATRKLEQALEHALSTSRSANTFRENLDQAEHTFARTMACAEALSAVLERVGVHVVEQADALVKFACDLRLIGFNAQVRSASLEHAGALEVLSAHARQTSDVLRNVTDDLLALVGRIVPELRCADQALRELSDFSNRERGLLRAETTQVENGLRQLGSHMTDDLAAIRSGLSQLHSKVQSTLQMIEKDDGLLAAIEHVGRLCTSVAEETSAYGEHGSLAVARGLGEIRNSYVTEGQRAVHDRVAGRSRLSATPHKLATVPTAEAPSGNNFELF